MIVVIFVPVWQLHAYIIQEFLGFLVSSKIV